MDQPFLFFLPKIVYYRTKDEAIGNWLKVGVENHILKYYSEGAGKIKNKSGIVRYKPYRKSEWDMSGNTELKNQGGFK